MTQDSQLFEHIANKRESCPECGEALVFRNGKAGPFLGCSAYPKCDYTKALHPEHDPDLDRLIPDSQCPECSKPLAVKHGRFGIFIGCSGFPDCHFIENKDGQEDNDTQIVCPKCQQGHLLKKQNRFGKTFYPCSAYPKCDYAVNLPPVKQSCEACGWPVMLQKHLRGKDVLVCPQKKCGHKVSLS